MRENCTYGSMRGRAYPTTRGAPLYSTPFSPLTSDQHFGHFNIIRLSRRPFGSLEEMNDTMISKWNGKVHDGDVVYILGDLFFRAAAVEPILQRLKGRKHLVLGNHDHSWTGKVRLGDYFESVQTLKELAVYGRILTLCHYPMLSYPQARRGYMIYGHIHNNTGDDYWPLIIRRPRMLNAGVDVNNFEPVSFEELLSNNEAFRQLHADTARVNPLTMFCAEA